MRTRLLLMGGVFAVLLSSVVASPVQRPQSLCLLIVGDSSQAAMAHLEDVVVALIRQKLGEEGIPQDQIAIRVYHFNKTEERLYCRNSLHIEPSDLLFVGLAEEDNRVITRVLLREPHVTDPRASLKRLFKQMPGVFRPSGVGPPVTSVVPGKPILLVADVSTDSEASRGMMEELSRLRAANGLSERQCPILVSSFSGGPASAADFDRLGVHEPSAPCLAVVKMSAAGNLTEVLGSPRAILRQVKNYRFAADQVFAWWARIAQVAVQTTADLAAAVQIEIEDIYIQRSGPLPHQINIRVALRNSGEMALDNLAIGLFIRANDGEQWRPLSTWQQARLPTGYRITRDYIPQSDQDVDAALVAGTFEVRATVTIADGQEFIKLGRYSPPPQ